ncbi:MAG: Holliday junction resolvase RuvX [Patescibacteria group bacterium]
MRHLGIDYGTKRVGLALSDESGTMAFPAVVLENNNELVKAVAQVIEDESVEAVVIGHSKNLDGEDNKVQAGVEAFMQELTLQVPIPIHLEPEFYSTQEAIRFQGRTKDTDAAAAAVILNSYLLKQH